MSRFKSKNPITATCIALIFIGCIMIIPIRPLLTTVGLSKFQTEYISLFIKMTFIFTLSFLAVKTLKIEKIVGISPEYKWKNKALNLIPIYLFLLGIASVISKDFSEVIPFNIVILLIACLSVGFAEEFLFRGVLQALFIKKYYKKKNGILVSIFSSSFAFGLFHLINLFKSETVGPVLIQVIFATFIGFFFGVMVLKTNKIIPLAITHALINFFFSLQLLPGLNISVQEDNTISLAPIIIFLPLLTIGILLLKKVNREEIKEKLNANHN